ncbi:hypothetical protein ACFQAT_11205 [Undibacterium arcticum]|uniref:Uncharacterized protein n=1 Tax=Undibacterium arcticum TaxID=1762892 RepID=A0ABV7F2A7_9BURK
MLEFPRLFDVLSQRKECTVASATNAVQSDALRKIVLTKPGGLETICAACITLRQRFNAAVQAPYWRRRQCNSRIYVEMVQK